MLMLKKSVSDFAHGLLLYIASDIPEGAQYKDNACDGDGGKHGGQYHDAACHGDIVVHAPCHNIAGNRCRSAQHDEDRNQGLAPLAESIA